MTTVFCKDCKHANYFGSPVPPTEWRCSHPEALVVSMVTGEHRYDLCSVMRGFGKCGPEGKLFEPKLTVAA